MLLFGQFQALQLSSHLRELLLIAYLHLLRTHTRVEGGATLGAWDGGREGRREGERDRREGERDGGRERGTGGRERGTEGGREGERDRGRERGTEGGREGRREGRREEGKKGCNHSNDLHKLHMHKHTRIHVHTYMYTGTHVDAQLLKTYSYNKIICDRM